jgi:serine/threonine/tyrosine protein kinase RAD53
LQTTTCEYTVKELMQENICRLIEWYEDPAHINLVLEYVDGSDLLEYIMKYPSDGLRE